MPKYLGLRNGKTTGSSSILEPANTFVLGGRHKIPKRRSWSVITSWRRLGLCFGRTRDCRTRRRSDWGCWRQRPGSPWPSTTVSRQVFERTLHYIITFAGIPYPRPVNLPQTSYSKREGKKVGKAIQKMNEISRPVYLRSTDDAIKTADSWLPTL